MKVLCPYCEEWFSYSDYPNVFQHIFMDHNDSALGTIFNNKVLEGYGL